MRLSPTRVEQALSQFEAQVIPEGHPVMPKLRRIYGDHTFFVAANGLNIVEPLDASTTGVPAGKVVNVASWSDSAEASLVPCEPAATEVVVEFEGDDDADRLH